LSYGGSRYAFDATGTGGPAYANVNVSGCNIVGRSFGLAGIHLKAFNRGTFDSISVFGFTTGAGWLNEGGSAVDCFSCQFKQNLHGIHQIGVTQGGNNYSPNAVHFFGGHVSENTGWGVY